MLQLDIFPVDPARNGLAEEAEDEAGGARLLGRIIQFPDGREVAIEGYRDEGELGEIMDLIGRELSEPYSIYTYRYFIHHWPELCILARNPVGRAIVGVVVCKLEHSLGQGYIAMLAVEESYRGMGLGTKLVGAVIAVMERSFCEEVVLETEVSNARSLSLYGRLGFIRESRFFRYYLNGSDAFRLKLCLERAAGQRRPAQNNSQGESNGSGGTWGPDSTEEEDGRHLGVEENNHGEEGKEGEEEQAPVPCPSTSSSSTRL